ncbi:hypothetical protein GCM10010260_43090 [Streptomyces filipinensis]|uniref:Uncharacterized protein n=1 Tax=Streptomyces filipinensis TaxID=66887 RepID=A0A918ICI7_9ACTN|nr:hypothetical protein GCM10010260_43090 [Streptomyces filipinensis]
MSLPVEADAGALVGRGSSGPEHQQAHDDRRGERNQDRGDDLAQVPGDGSSGTVAVAMTVRVTVTAAVVMAVVRAGCPLGALAGVLSMARLAGLIRVLLHLGHRRIIARTVGAHCSPRHI